MPPPIPDKIPCTTAAELERELQDIRPILAADETEDNWEKKARALQRFASITRGGAAKVESEFIKAMKELSRRITSAMCSERTRLSGTACDLLTTVAPRLAERFDSILPLFLPEILSLCTRTNKLFISRGQKLVVTIISHNKLGSVLPYLREAVKDKSQSLRTVATEATVVCLKELESKTLRSKIEDIEAILRMTATDSHPEVRKLSKEIFEAYKKAFPERVDNFSDPLTPITRRYLDIPSRDGTSKPAQASKSSKPVAGPSKPRNLLSASTSSAHPSTAKPPVHSRSVSTSTLREVLMTSANGTTALGQPVRPKPMPVQSDRSKDSSRSQAALRSVGHSRDTSASSSSTSRTVPTLSPTVMGKPFAPTRSMSENSKPQRLPQDSVRLTRTPAGTSAPSTVKSDKSALTSTVATGPQRTTVSASLKAAAVRPPLTRPPTAPAALHSSASRRQVSTIDSSKGPTPGKSMLQGGAKRIVSQSSSKPLSAAVQAVRQKGFVPSRGTGKGPTAAGGATATEKHLQSLRPPVESDLESDKHELQEVDETEDVDNPPGAVDNAMSPMEVIEEGSFVQDSREEVVAAEGELLLEHLSSPSHQEVQSDDLGATVPQEADLELLQQDVEITEEQRANLDEACPAGVSPTAGEAEQPAVAATSESVPASPQTALPQPSSIACHPPKVHRTLVAEAEAQRAARREEKRRLFEALSAEERDAIRQRKREKKHRKGVEQPQSDHNDVEHAASIPLPPDEDESRKPSPVSTLVPSVDVVISETRAIEIALEAAASIPLPEDDPFERQELTPTPPLDTYAVVLPRALARPFLDVSSTTIGNSDPSSSRSTTPENNFSGATTAHYPGTEVEDEGDALTGLQYSSGNMVIVRSGEGTAADEDLVDDKASAAQLAAQREKEKREAADRLFAEMDVNVALSKT